MKNVSIKTSLTKTGFDIFTNKRMYSLNYPLQVWSSLPRSHQQVLAEHLAVFFTQHLAFMKNYHLTYSFSPPIFSNLFFQGLIFSMPETAVVYDKYKHKTSQLIKRLYNSQFKIKYQFLPTLFNSKPAIFKKNNALIPFTFGKDSLLTLALCKKIGLSPQLFFVEEPLSEMENQQRRKIFQKFERETGYKVNFLNNSLGLLRQKGKEMWGWDMLQMQYATLLLPYAYKSRVSYLFFSNEKNTNEIEVDAEGFVANFHFEQSRAWMLQLNHLYRYFGLPTQIGSIISPIYELFITYILHKNFPELAKFQISCEGDSALARSKRWCGVCGECGLSYLFIKATGVDPKLVGFNEDLLNTKRYVIYSIFNWKTLNENVPKVVDYYGESMLAFWLAYKRGVRGHLINLFKKHYLKEVTKQKTRLIYKYVNYYPDLTLPEELRKKLDPIYKAGIRKLKVEITDMI